MTLKEEFWATPNEFFASKGLNLGWVIEQVERLNGEHYFNVKMITYLGKRQKEREREREGLVWFGSNENYALSMLQAAQL